MHSLIKQKRIPKISIVTPSFNQGAYIEDTIKSVLTQDYPNIEYMVVDGGSTDNTLDILKKYTGEIRWISGKDNGQSDAISKGFKVANGDILAWLNSDDTYLPGAISNVVTCFNNSNADVVYGRANFVDVNGDFIDEVYTAPFDYNRLAPYNFICQPATFFKKEAWDIAGGIDQSLHYTMDYDLWVRMAQKCKFIYLEETLSTYRLHEDSKTVSRKHSVEFHTEIIKTIRKYFDWAPINRVYIYCYHVVRLKWPYLGGNKFLTITLALCFCLLKYLLLNRGVRFADIKLITFSNMKKFFLEKSR